MNTYEIEYSELALSDIRELTLIIKFKYKAPLTARRYVQGLINEINKLRHSPEALPLQTRKSLTQYGQNIRRLNYKRIAVIYSVYNHTVYIHRVIAANAIAGL